MEKEKRKEIVSFLGRYLGAVKEDYGQEHADVAFNAIRRLWHTFKNNNLFEDLTSEEIRTITSRIRKKNKGR